MLVGQLLQIPTTFFGFYHQHFLHLKLTINFSFSISGLFSGGGSLAFFQYMGWNTATFHAEWATNFYVWLAILAASLALLLDNGPFSAQERNRGRVILVVFCVFSHFLISKTGWTENNKTASRSQFRGSVTSICILIFLAFGHTMNNANHRANSLTWGEGSTMDMHGGRVATEVTTKNHVEELQLTYESCQSSRNRRRMFKRSFQRAQKRASIHGFTLYQGKWMTAKQLGTTIKDNKPSIQVPQNVTATSGQKRKRLSMMCWNAGGLRPADWDWLQLWLTQQRLDVIALQETHWPFSGEWQQPDYYCLHSGSGARGAGVMTLVAKRLCTPAELSWDEPIPGRLLHVRIHGKTRGIDVINGYQHVHAHNRMEDRACFWDSLQTTLSQIPSRNNLIALGGWNTSLTKCSTSTGLATYAGDTGRSTGPIHTDAHLFHNILQQHDMTSVNTWQHHLGPTFKFQDRHSRIDHVCCRRMFSDQTSKQVTYLTEFPLNQIDGAHHVPILVSLLKVWHFAPQRAAAGWTMRKRLELYKQWRNPTQHTQQLQDHINAAINSLPPEGDRLLQVHQTLNQIESVDARDHQQPVFLFDVTPFQLFQEHTQQLFALEGNSIKNCFQAWFHVIRRGHARKQMRTTAKMARRQRLQRIFDLAGRAEQAHDHFTLYQAIHELAPKKWYRRFQLRDPNGHLLNPDQAADMLQEWFQQLYNDDSAPLSSHSFQWPFSEEGMREGFQQMPLLKAVAPEYAPSPYWQCAAHNIAAYLTPYLRDCGEHGHFPECWSQGTLFFIPKVAKRSLLPKELRPITLLEPCSKICMGLMAQCIQNEAGTRLQSYPQFAYMRRRGGDDALQRIRQHCCRVRTICEDHQYTVHQQARGSTPRAVSGGAMLSLDLSKAFDNVNRERLLLCLRRLDISEDLIFFLQTVYCQTFYRFEYKG